MTILVNLEMTYFYFTKDFDSEDGLIKLKIRKEIRDRGINPNKMSFEQFDKMEHGYSCILKWERTPLDPAIKIIREFNGEESYTLTNVYDE